MRTAAEFASTVRHGVRVGRTTLVLHARPLEQVDAATRVGFVVSKRVGNAVQRNRVKRQLRHLTASELRDNPCGLQIVLRAQPAAAEASYTQLGVDNAGAWAKLRRRLETT